MFNKVLAIIFGKESNIYLGISKANSLPLLPAKVENFNNILIVRILRFIGGLCLIFILVNTSKENSSLMESLPLIGVNPFTICVFAITHTIYIIVICLIKDYMVYYHLKNKNYEVRNNSLKRAASVIGITYACVKGACQNVSILPGMIGAGFGVDNVLNYMDRDPVFKPLLKNQVSPMLTNMGWPEKNSDLDLSSKKPSN